MAKTQTALAITAIGSPLTKIELPIPEPKGENELLIKLTATAIAPFDEKLRDQGLFDLASRLPAIVTFDLVGVVEAYSPDISANLKSSFPIGTHVMAQPTNLFHPLSGGLQQYSILDARFTSVVPKSITDLEAAAYPINAFTSFASLFSSEGDDKRGLGIPFPGTEGSEDFNYKNAMVVILGGGSRCGKLGIQFAKMVGIGKILTSASKGSFEELKALGATHCFDRKSATLVDDIRKVTGDDLVFVYDTMSVGEEVNLGIDLLSSSKKGRFVRLLAPGEVDCKGKDVKAWHMTGASQFHPAMAGIFWKRIAGWVDGGLKAGNFKVVEGLDLEGVNKVMDGYRDGGLERAHVRISE